MARLKERISIFLEKMDIEKTLEIYFPDLGKEIKKEFEKRIVESMEQIQKTWYEQPDWRFGQLLVNLNIIPNIPGFWYYMEDDDVLINQGVSPRECLFWGNNYDKDMNRLPETRWMLIKDMKTGHIQNILNGRWTGNPKYTKAFREELQLRQKENEEKQT